MKKNERAVERCRRLIEALLGWGDPSSWNNEDFEQLSEKIFDRTAVRLSVSTLKRIWGKVKYDSSPTAATLNTLARFAGFGGWRELLQRQGEEIGEEETGGPGEEDDEEDEAAVGSMAVEEGGNGAVAAAGRASGAGVEDCRVALGPIIVSTIVFVALISLLSARLIHPKVTDPAGLRFESRQTSDDLPNSVVFYYDASPLQPEEVMIQQSWDERRREVVPATGKEHTSIYYYPGYFVAKLVVDGEIKRQSEVFIRTKGWKAIIEHAPLPVYLRSDEVKDGAGGLGVPSSLLREKTGSSLFNDVWTYFANIREFPSVTGDHFTLETTLRNTSTVEECLCRKVNITILGKENVIIIPLSDKGCISDIRLLAGYDWIRGKDQDLSAFGCDFSGWQRVRCSVDDHRVKIELNGRLIFTTDQTAPMGNIIGIRIAFEGAGELREVGLQGRGERLALLPEGK